MVNIILIAEFSGHGKHLRAGTLRVRQTTCRETQLLGRYFKVRLSFKLYTVFHNIQFRVPQQVRRLQLRGNVRSEMSELPKMGRVLRRVPRKIPFFLRLWKQGMLWPKNLLQVGSSVLQT